MLQFSQPSKPEDTGSKEEDLICQVKAAAKKFNYNPNMIAGSLRLLLDKKVALAGISQVDNVFVDG